MSTVRTSQATRPLVTSLASRLADYRELARPRIVVMALVAAAVGYTLAAGDGFALPVLVHALGGIGLAAAAAGALNQLFERHTDSMMPRTANRPLPAGRLQPAEGLLLGLGAAVIAVTWLAIAVNIATAAWTLATLVLYLAIYTPLKRVSSLATTVGAVPGALPPVLGWLAGGGSLDAAAFSLFAILFLWQFPHFLAIAWLCRDDYAAAGLKMLPAAARRPGLTGLIATLYALALVPVSLMPRALGLAGDAYVVAAVLLGLGYVTCAVRFSRHETTAAARGLLWASLIHLPLLLAALTVNFLQLTS